MVVYVRHESRTRVCKRYILVASHENCFRISCGLPTVKPHSTYQLVFYIIHNPTLTGITSQPHSMYPIYKVGHNINCTCVVSNIDSTNIQARLSQHQLADIIEMDD